MNTNTAIYIYNRLGRVEAKISAQKKSERKLAFAVGLTMAFMWVTICIQGQEIAELQEKVDGKEDEEGPVG